MTNFVRLTLSPLVGIAMIIYETVWGERSVTVYMVGCSLIGITPFLGDAGPRGIIEALRDVKRNGNGGSKMSGLLLMGRAA